MRIASASRFLSLWFPRLPIDRIRRSQGASGRAISQRPGPQPGGPADDPGPLVVVGKAKGAFRLTSLDAEAERLGLHATMALADARAMIPRLVVAEEDRAADAALLGAVADWCDRYTPLVALDGEDGLLLDI